eukprot:1476787-Pyramimonas_sp.AAC.1
MDGLDDAAGLAAGALREDSSSTEPAAPGQFQQPPPNPFLGSGSSGSGGEPLTLDAIGALIARQLRPIQHDIAAIKKHGVSHEDLEKATRPLKAQLDDMKCKFDTFATA